MIEARMSSSLALRLGATLPRTVQEHREMLRGGSFILLRDRESGLPMFWPIAAGISARSSA
jgi:hypothetical protein